MRRNNFAVLIVKVSRAIVLPLLVVLAIVADFSTAFAANGIPGLLPFQGRAVDTSGSPITVTSTVKFRIYPPTGTCYLYEDTQSVLPNSYGMFSVMLGSSGNSSGPANSFSTVFNNDVSVPMVDSCSGSYLPSANDWRRLEVVVDGIAMSEMQTIGASAFAINAQLLSGKTSDDFINVTGAITQTNIGTLVSGADASALHKHDSLYARRDGANSFTGAISTTSTIAASGSITTGSSITAAANITASGNITTSSRVVATGSSSAVGIGTGAPSADLHISKTAPSVLLTAASGGAGTMRFDFYSGSTQRASIQASEAANGLKFYSGSTNALELDASGNAIFSASMKTAGTIGLGQYTDAQEAGLVTALSSLGTVGTGTMWVNTTANNIRYWDGASVQIMGLGGGGGGGGGGGSITSITAGTGLTGGTITTSGTIALANSGVTAGTYQSVTVDAKGRVTAGTAPTTLAGYNITDGVKNAGGAVSIQSGPLSGLPAFGTAGRIYIATDSQYIFADTGSNWVMVANTTGSGGTVTNTSGTYPLSVSNGATTPVVKIVDGTAAGQSLRWDGSTWVPSTLYYTELVLRQESF